MMADKGDTSGQQPVPAGTYCEHCHSEIPPSAIDQPEPEEYSLYFCGLECFEKWREEAREEE